MEILSICIFLIYCYGLGFTVTRFIKDNQFETTVMRLGVGLGSLPFLALLLNVVHIPLDWRIILIISLAVPLYDLYPAFKKNNIFKRIRMPSTDTLLVLVIFFACLSIYCNGPFNYPWLENDDSWGHAAGIKYIALEKNLSAPQGVFYYLNPYPPGYDLIFGILHQIHSSLYWTLKFFNGFIISLGFLFFYIFVKNFSQNNTVAIIATFFLACIPCYLSHFIWAHALAVTLFFPAFYTVLKTQKDKRYILPGCLAISGILLTQPTQGIKFIIMLFIVIGVSAFFRKRGWKNMVVVFLIGAAMSLIWWGPILNSMRTGDFKLASRNDTHISGKVRKFSANYNKRIFAPTGGTATRAYNIKDYLIAPKYNMINNPIGVGPMLCLLAILGIFYLLKHGKDTEIDKKIYSTAILSWLLFTFLGMNTQTFNLPFGLFAFRFWMLFAIPVSILAAESLCQSVIRKNKTVLRNSAFIVVIISVLASSAYFKFKVNTSIWPRGVFWSSHKELSGYIWMRNHLPVNSKVFAFTDNLFVIGHDMRADFWSPEYKESFDHAIDLNSRELHTRLKKRGFQYLLIGERAVIKFGVDTINDKLQTLSNNNKYSLIYKIDRRFWIFKIS